MSFRTILLSFLILFLNTVSHSQEQSNSIDKKTEEKVIELMELPLSIISGPKTKERDFDAFRMSFMQSATIGTEYRNKELGTMEIRILSIEEFIEQNRAFYKKNDFWEIAKKHHILSSDGQTIIADQLYEIYLANPDEAEPLVTGINTYELKQENGEWKIESIFYKAYGDLRKLPIYFSEIDFENMECNPFDLPPKDFYEFSFTDYPDYGYESPVLENKDQHTRRVVQKDFSIPRSFKNIVGKNTRVEMIVQFFVDTNAEVQDAKIIQSSEWEDLDKEALRAINDLKFLEPAKINGTKVKMCFEMPIVIKVM